MEKEWVELDTTSCRLSITMRRTTYDTIQLDLNKFGYNNKGDKMTLSGFLNVVFFKSSSLFKRLSGLF